jgi:hypothetical protein
MHIALLIAPALAQLGLAQTTTVTSDPALDAELQRALAADAQASAEGQAAAKAPASTPGTPPSSTSMNPDIAFILDVALAGFSDEQPRQGGGHDPQKNGFTLQQLELALGKAVDPYLRLDAFVVFSQFGVEIEEAYATTMALPASLQLRAGQFLTRFGRHNPTHPHAWDFADQPFMWTQVFGAEGNRGVGLELSYLTPLPWYVELGLAATDAAGEGTARSFWGAEDLGVQSPRDLQLTLTVKQFFPLSSALSLLWGLSGAAGPNPSGYHNRTEIGGTDLYLRYRPIHTDDTGAFLSLTAEALVRRRQVPGDVLRDGGGYATLEWNWSRHWGAGARYEYGTPVWNGDGVADNDYLDPLWDGHRQRVSTAVTYWPSEFSRLRLQGSVDHTSGADDRVWGLMLALEVLIGAHGAHAF